MDMMAVCISYAFIEIMVMGLLTPLKLKWMGPMAGFEKAAWPGAIMITMATWIFWPQELIVPS
jgi:hypothetical protein